MAQVCPRCQHANPDEAVYCHHDGAVLNPLAAPVGLLVRPLVLPSGQACRSVEDLAGGLAQAWPDAVRMLADGSLAQLLRDSGRLDLGRAADEAQAHPDRDLGLYQLLGRLPAPTGPQPRLEVYPRRLILGPYPAGGQHRSSLRVANRGAGVLQGKVSAADAPWLRLDETSGRQDAAIHADDEQSVALWIDTRGLTSGQVHGGKLVVVTGGGLVEVPVSLEIAALPYPAAPFKGVASPRKLAEMMRGRPKDAAAALDSGEVATWFATNGWAYPVSGKPAEGLAAVQQFFECLGLAKPPPIDPTPAVLELHSDADRKVAEAVVLRTASKKWVYAQAESTASWLRVTTPSVGGPQEATVTFEADPATLPEGVSEADLTLTANGGTRRTVRVRLHVRRPRSGPPVPGRRPNVGWLRPLVVGAVALLLYRLLAILPADVLGRLFAAGPPEPGSAAAWLTTPTSDDGFLRRFVLATWWLGGLAGVSVAWKRDGGVLDLLGGLVAGAAAGLAVAATVGCVLLLGDELPRRVLATVVGTGSTLPVGPATALWLLLATAGWAVLGLAVGTLALVLGRTGSRFLDGVTVPLRVLAGWVGADGWGERLRLS